MECCGRRRLDDARGGPALYRVFRTNIGDIYVSYTYCLTINTCRWSCLITDCKFLNIYLLFASMDLAIKITQERVPSKFIDI